MHRPGTLRQPTPGEIQTEVAHLERLGAGEGGKGPWVNRSHRINEMLIRSGLMPDCVAVHVNTDYLVQRCQYGDHPGIDHLIIRRNDGEAGHPGWLALQQMKDTLAPNGTERFGYEIFPPRRYVVDDCHLYHVWVMPIDWTPPIGLHPNQDGTVQR